MSTHLQAIPLSGAEARSLTERIRTAAESLWSLLLEAYERKAWRALGYETWQGYVEKEFGMHRRTSYKLLDQGRVIRALTDVCPDGHIDITEAAARDIKPVLPEVVERVRVQVGAGEQPERAVQQVVAQVREERKETRAESPAVASPPKEAIPTAPKMNRIDTKRLAEFVRYAIDAAHAANGVTDAQVDALDTNDVMLAGLRAARDLADRIIRRRSKDASASA